MQLFIVCRLYAQGLIQPLVAGKKTRKGDSAGMQTVDKFSDTF